jgi:hypothetical protein
MWSLFKGAGIVTLGASMLAEAFGEGACAYHCAEEVKRVAFREGLELREIKEKLKVAGHRQPAKHYPSSYDARVRRLAEIESDLQEPDRVSVALDRLETKVQALRRMQEEAEKDRIAKVQRVRLYRYLRAQGYDDPARLFNL